MALPICTPSKKVWRASFFTSMPKLDIINLLNFCQSVGWQCLFLSTFRVIHTSLHLLRSGFWLLTARGNLPEAKWGQGQKADFLSVGGVFTWVNMAYVKCPFGLKDKETRSKKSPALLYVSTPVLQCVDWYIIIGDIVWCVHPILYSSSSYWTLSQCQAQF